MNTFSIAARKNRPSVLIYRTTLLPLSETFVLSQPEALEHFTPYFVGCSRVDGLRTPEGRSYFIGNDGALGHAHKMMYKVFGFAPGLMRELRRLNPVLVHTHFGVDSVQGLRLARRLGTPLVVTFHGYDATMKEEYARSFSYDFRRYLRWRPIIQKEASLFVAVSEFVRSKLIEQGFPQEKISVHYVGVDTELFAPDLSVPRKPIVLFAGRLVDSKGCDYLIRAMALVQRKMPDVRLIVIGDGPLRHELEQMASACLHNFSFLGARSQSEVRHWMNRAKVFSVPSFTTPMGTSEGFGLVFAEAQSMGLPVASFATGGIPEAVAHGVTGLLARERDVESLASNISALFNNDSLWHRFSAAAIRRTREQFDLKEQSAKLEEMYSRLLTRQSVATIRNSVSIPLQG
ncbi:glycosyltransferase [Alloacidobacterium sp.]|uniref:glycosyltransferase n=1 Tax=Alloacidobacterium sp. TaxID=2951999 RepID=UPI002D413651|nr:glycosyltransferase [Alloacidobacterium sp.]HYK36744.1 glycosyltransferase [Alloacidobacterium sp.]